MIDRTSIFSGVQCFCSAYLGGAISGVSGGDAAIAAAPMTRSVSLGARRASRNSKRRRVRTDIASTSQLREVKRNDVRGTRPLALTMRLLTDARAQCQQKSLGGCAFSFLNCFKKRLVSFTSTMVLVTAAVGANRNCEQAALAISSACPAFHRQREVARRSARPLSRAACRNHWSAGAVPPWKAKNHD